MSSAQADRRAWLEGAVRAQAGEASAVPGTSTGAWSKRLQGAGVPDLSATWHSLQTLSTQLGEQHTALVSKLSAQMSVAGTIVPEAAAQAQQLTQDAMPLRLALEKAEKRYEQMTPAAGTPEAHALSELHSLSQVKHRMQSARDTLHAAESWSLVEGEVDGHLADGDWEKAAQRLAGMEHTLANFDASSEYVAARRALLERLLAALDEAVAKALHKAVDAQDVDGLIRCARVYASVHRAEQFTVHYTRARRAAIQNTWQAAPVEQRTGAFLGALEQLAADERQVAPLLYQEPERGVEAVLVAAVDAVPLHEHIDTMAQRPEALPVLVESYMQAYAAVKAIDQARLGAGSEAPIASDTIPTHTAWPACLLDLYVPYQASYRTREAAFLQHTFAHRQGAFEARRDRAYVQTADARQGSWAACVQDMAQLCCDEIDACRALSDAATERMLRLADARADDVLEAVHTALLPVLRHRLVSTLDQLKTRHARHMQSLAPDANTVLAEDMDPIPDWDLVHAGVRVMELNPYLDTQVSAWHTHLLERVAGAQEASVRAKMASLPAPLEVAHSAHALVLAQLLGTFRMHLEAYSAQGAWASAAPQEHLPEVRIPSFSKSPTEAMVKLGEGLLNLPRLLESLVEREQAAFQYAVDTLPFAHDEAPEVRAPRTRAHRALSVSLLTQDAAVHAENTTYTAEQVLSLWLRSLTLTLLTELQAALPRMAKDPRCDRAQLAADVDYLGTIASALNASTPALREWADVLALTPAAAQALPKESALRTSRAFQQVFAK